MPSSQSPVRRSPVRVRRLSLDDVARLAIIYCVCFGGAPWFEVYNVDDVAAEIREVLSWPDAVMVVAEVDGVIVGAAWSFCVRRKKDVMDLVSVRPICPYISEIFVDPEYRGHGVAKQMVDRLLDCLVDIKTGVVRTSVNQPIIIRMFEALGWTIVATEDVMSQKCIDGVTTDAPDTRVILVGRIPGN